MKRIFSCLLAVIIAFSLAACSQADGSEISTSLASKQDGTASGNINAALFVVNNNTDTGDFNEDFFANKIVTHYLKPGRAV